MFAFAFAPTPEPRRRRPSPARPRWRMLLIAACGVVLVAAAFPWNGLLDAWGQLEGPRAFRTTTGFSVAMTSLLCLLLCLVETGSQHSAQVVRPGCFVASAGGALVMALAILDGPGTIAGLEAVRTNPFLIAAAAVATAAFAATALHRALHRRADAR